MHKYWKKYLELLDSDINTKVFDNLKNLLVCTLLFAAGSNVLHGDQPLFIGLEGSNLAGWGLIAVSALLTLLNVSDGIRKLSRLPYHTALQILLCLLYLVLAERVVEIVWSFRAE
ncbi:hypothetical protein D9M68_333590 [compost metagenome]